jgi:hypothetical protein
MKFAVAFLVLAAQAELFPQAGPYPGGYPPGQYPGGYPGQYPGGSVPAPTWPHKGKHDKSQNEPTVHIKGKLSKIEEKTVSIDVPDGRVIDFQHDAKTKVYRESNEIKFAELKVGDEVSAEGNEDKDGYYYATAIRAEKNAPSETAKTQPAKTEPAKSEPAKSEPPKSESAKGETAPAEERPTETIDAPAPVQDAGDPGPPTLKHGAKPRSQNAEIAENTTVIRPLPPSVQAVPPAAPAAQAAPALRAQSEPLDPVIEKARAAAETFSANLPNYVCKEFMARFASMSRPVDWQALDVVSTEIVYEGGKESYRNVQVNGKARKSLEDTGGAWSTGEFATTMRDILSPWTAAEFHVRRDAQIAGMTAKVYDFKVERPNSHWHVQVASQSINPAYKGSLWIDPKSGRVLRIEMQARSLPEEFTLDVVESAVEYQNVRIGEGMFLLPAHAESLSCERGTSNCSRNVIDFRNYHKFSSESDITFADQK